MVDNSNIHELIIVSTTTKVCYFYVSNVIINDFFSKAWITCCLLYQELPVIKVTLDNFSLLFAIFVIK